MPHVARRWPKKHLAAICLVIASAGLQRVAALDTKWETCGLEGLWFHDKVLAKGLEDNNRNLVECALTAKKDFAPISNNRFCKDNNCIFSAKDDAMIDFMLSKARKEQLAEKDKSHGSIYTVLSHKYIPGKNDKLMKKWNQKISNMGISSEEAQETACWKGATVLEKVSTLPRAYRYDEMLTLDEKKAEDRRFAESRRINEANRAGNKNASPATDTTVADDPKRDKRHDLPAGRLVKVRSISFKEKAGAPNSFAVCETKTVMRKMPDGYYRGSIHCGGSAYYTYTVGAEIEEIREKAPEKPSYHVRKCIEDCLAKCGGTRLGEAPTYSNTVCTQGCKPSCESTWDRN